MRDSVGSSLLLIVIIIILGIVSSVIIASNTYTKAYKAKTNINGIIDRYYMVNDEDCFSNPNCILSIDKTLSNMGYKVSGDISNCSNSSILRKVEKINNDGEASIDVSLFYPSSINGDNFNGYCVFKNTINDTSYYYTIVTFSYFDLNTLNIGTLYKMPVYGETRTYYFSEQNGELL